MSPSGRAAKLSSETLERDLSSDLRSSQIQIRVKGKDLSVPSVQIDGRAVIARGKWLKIAAVHDEELVEGETIADPQSFVLQLEKSALRADIFTFVQKLPDTTPKYSYQLEWDNLAVIPITTFSDWWERRVEASVRRAARKAAKSGVTVKVVEFDNAFVEGIVKINNETPVRQGRAFWHFQKSFEAVKRENLTYSERNEFLGAYFQDELVGFVRMTYTDRVANILQILSMTKHYDKRLTNALITKAVEVCEQKGMSYLTYCNYVYNDPNSSLTEFKRRNGFDKVLLPRYFVPLTTKGRLALRLGLHRKLVQRIPKPLLTQILKLRSNWYARRLKSVEGSF